MINNVHDVERIIKQVFSCSFSPFVLLFQITSTNPEIRKGGIELSLHTNFIIVDTIRTCCTCRWQ